MNEQWTDERIEEEIQGIDDGSLVYLWLRKLMRRMRDELTAQYAAERAENKKLRQILAVKLTLFDSEIDDMLAQPDAE